MTSNPSFFTIKHPTESVLKEKGSKFISFAFPVSDEEEVQNHLNYLKKKYANATHHCYAYTLGANLSRYRANDDGEPAHTAGEPILGQLKKRNLTNVLVVVVRYFGGIKLGVSGLIRAYREAAQNVLLNSTIIASELRISVHIHYAYDAISFVMKLVDDFNLQIIDQLYTDRGLMHANVPQQHWAALQSQVSLLKALGNDLQVMQIDATSTPK